MDKNRYESIDHAPVATRVLHVGWGHPPHMAAGPVYYVHQLCLKQKVHGIKVACFAASCEEEKTSTGKPSIIPVNYDGIPYRIVRNRPIHYFGWQQPGLETENPVVEDLFKKVLNEFRPGVVHFHNLMGLSMRLPLVAQEHGCATVFSAHNYWMLCPRDDMFTPNEAVCMGPRDGASCAPCVNNVRDTAAFMKRADAARKILCGSIDMVLAVSERVREIFIGFGVPPDRVVTSHIGSDSAVRNWEILGAKRSCEVPGKGPVHFSYLGSLMPRKGLHVFIEALSYLGGYSDKFVAEVFGAGNRDDYQERIRSIAARSGYPAGSLFFRGYYRQTDLPTILANSDIAVIPPIWEDNAPQTVMEALGAGLPVIGSRIGGIPDFVTDSINGLLFKPGDAEELAVAMQKIIADRELISKLRGGLKSPVTMADHACELSVIYQLVCAGREGNFVEEAFDVAYRKAEELAETGETKSAITILSDLLDKYPDTAKLHNDLGVLYYRDGETEKALSHHRLASRLEPDNVTFKKNLADFCFVGLSKSEEAMQIYLNILSANPRDAETWASLGYVCSTMERPDDAAFFYGKALEIDPLNEAALKGLETVATNKVSGSADESATGESGLSEKSLAAKLLRTVNKVSPEVSIVIPVFNKVDYTRKCLEMIAENTPAGVCEIIVIDNASTDATKEFLESLKDSVKYIANKQNLGYARANNQGVRMATGKYLLFLNNDTEVLQGWIEPLTKVLEQNSGIGIAAPKLIYPNGTIQHCGKVWRNVMGPDSHPEHLYLCEPGNSAYVNSSREFGMVTGACIIVRRDEFMDAGMFDENYENGWEDDDLCYAFTSRGHRIFYCAESTVIHHENVTLKESFSTATFKKNRERFFSKWGQMVERDDLKYYIEDGFALSRSKSSGELEWAHKGTFRADAKSVLVSNLVRGGDVLLTTTLLPEIRKRHPHARITFACAPAFAEILEGNPYVDKIMPFGQNYYSEEDWNKVAELASTYEAAYLAQPIPDLGRDFFTTLRDGNWHLTDIFAAKAGVYHYHRKPELYLKDKDIAEAMDIIGRNGIDTGRPYVVFHYAAQDDFKSWNPDEMKKLIQKMHASYPSLQYVLIGGKESESVAGPNLVNVSGKTTILQSAAIISKAECFIGVDSLPAHLTIYQQTQAIILFGGTLQRFCGPLNDNARAIEKSRADMITADDVAKSLRELPQFSNIDAGSLPAALGGVSRPPVTGKISIVILTFNELKYTRECIESIKRHTPEPHEVIFVDNASKDGTVKWLRKIVTEHGNYRLIENEKNEGFAKGCNQGIEASSGEYILLLNNDVVVTDNWLSGMLECLNSAPDTGIVGPMTNNISGPQKVRDVDYKTMGRMHDYAKSFREMHRYRRIPLRRIVGFCMLFRRQLADKIGLLDTSFGTGNFEDDDYCLRATLAEFRNLIAGDVFIHHYGSRSFIGNRIDYSAAMTGNIKIFDEKWSGIDISTPFGKRVAAFNFIDKAIRLNQRGQLDNAIGTLIEGIRYAPEEKALYYNLAEMLLDEKIHKDALEAVNSMPAGSENDLKRLEIVAYCTEDLKEAAKYAERILEMDKAYAPAWNLKGMIAQKQRDSVAAEGFFRQASGSDPGYGAPYTNRGMLKWASDEQDEALGLLEKGFVLSSTSTDNVTLYHSAITALEQFERAERIFQEAKDLHPENKRILFFLIDIFIKQGKLEMAMREVERAMLDIGIDDGMLSAALALREEVGTKEIDKTVKNKGTLSLCMIVKNEEQHLARCLLSAGPAVDEMIIVDTGSTDRTKDIARAYGARVFDFPWTNDFSEARNYSLSKAVGDWILVLDADEVISPLDYVEFARIVKNRPSRPVAYTMITRNYTYEVTSKGWTANDRKYLGEEAGTGWFPSAKVRLFINDKQIRFQNPVHEFVEASLERAGIEIKISSIPVHHYGRFDKDKLIEKGKKYFLLGKKKIEDLKGNFKAIKELAIQALELQEYDTSVELWKEAIKLNQTDPDVFLNIGYAYLKLERYGEALDSSRRAVELNPSMKEAVLNYAGCEFLIGDIGKTISVLETLLQTYPDYPSAMLLVAAAYYVQGQKEKGLGLFEKLRKRGFNWTNFIDEQSRGAMSLGKFDQAILLLEVAVKTGNINKDTDKLLAECQSKKVELSA